MIEKSELTAVIPLLSNLCKQHGIKRVKLGDLELEFGASETVSQDVMERFAKALAHDYPTDEEILFHSAPGGVPPKPAEPEPPKNVRTRGRSRAA